MSHVKQQHGGWATAAIRRGEQYVACATCGMPRHPRLILRQAAHVPPPRQTWRSYAAAVAAIVAFLAVVAQAGPY